MKIGCLYCRISATKKRRNSLKIRQLRQFSKIRSDENIHLYVRSSGNKRKKNVFQTDKKS